MSDALYAPKERGLVGLNGQPLAPPASRWFTEEQDVKDYIRSSLGELDDLDIAFNDVLVAKYIRDEIVPGLVASAETQKEDSWQGVVGLVLKLGPTAFQDDERTKFPWERWIAAGLVSTAGEAPFKPGDWVLYRNSDGWDKDIAFAESRTQFVKCRFIQDAHIRGRVRYPGRLY